MRQRIANCVLWLALTLAAPAAPAHEVAPDMLLRALAVEVIDRINQDAAVDTASPAVIAALVETRILPIFDFAHMTRLAMAHHWSLASPEQQRLLTEEFKTLLVRTYTTALRQYRGEAIHFKPLRAAPFEADTEVTVRSEVKQDGKEPMTLDYQMEKTQAGWKIHDVKVAGVRLVSTYRDVFAEKIRDGGVDGLIKFLADANRGGTSRFNAIKTSFWETSQLVFAIFRDAIRRGRQ